MLITKYLSHWSFFGRKIELYVAVLHGFIKKGIAHKMYFSGCGLFTLYTDFAKLFQVPKAFYLYVLHDNNEIQLL